MNHVVGGVRAQETPVQDRDARLGDRDEAPVDEGRTGRVGGAIYAANSDVWSPPSDSLRAPFYTSVTSAGEINTIPGLEDVPSTTTRREKVRPHPKSRIGVGSGGSAPCGVCSPHTNLLQ
jgi:hypothetical protein